MTIQLLKTKCLAFTTGDAETQPTPLPFAPAFLHAEPGSEYLKDPGHLHQMNDAVLLYMRLSRANTPSATMKQLPLLEQKPVSFRNALLWKRLPR